MMLQFSNTLMIKSAPEEIFNYLNRMENYPEWNYAVSEIKRTGYGAEGEKYQLHRNQIGPGMENVTVTERIENKKLTMELSGGWFPYSVAYEITSDAEKTMLTNNVTIHSSGMNGLVAKIFQGNLKKAVGENLQVLKAILEKKTRS
ncbi:SRPBCC family protein [Bacillus marinisedimentorum]|uniref:SRPBCC family protein n=1 Tax=Bacillus marinisedimentorum TaxID=1821260 RepID=UPI0008729080